MKMTLDWYYDSPYFFGGIVPKGIKEVFAPIRKSGLRSPSTLATTPWRPSWRPRAGTDGFICS